MIQLLKKQTIPALVFALLLVLLMGLVLVSSQTAPVAEPSAPYPFAKWLLALFQPDFTNIFWAKAFTVIFLLLFAVYFHYLVSSYQVLFKNSSFPAVFIVFFSVLFSMESTLNIETCNNLFLMLAFHNLWQTQNHDTKIVTLLNVGFFFSFTVLLIPQYILLLPAILIGYSILGNPKLSDFFKILWAFVTPILLALFLCYFFDRMDLAYSYFKEPFFQFRTSWKPNISQYVTLAVLLFFLIIILNRLRSNFYRNNVRNRRIQLSMVVFLFFAFLLSLINRKSFADGFSMLAIPLSIFFSYFFVSGKKMFWAELSFGLLLLCFILLRFDYQII